MTIPERLANRDLDPSILEPVSEPPPRAQVVIVGGGVIGSSIAYHLTKLGITDVVVVERTRLTGGTTWHAAGLVSQVRGTHALTELSRINASLYAALPDETGVETGFRRVGSLTLARTPGRMQELRGAADMHREFDVEARILEPSQVRDWWPIAEVDDLVGALLTPADATVNPGDATLALAKGAHDRGAVFAFGVTVTGFRIEHGAVTGVETDRGPIEADTVVLAAGLWTSELARLAGTSVSLYPAEHVWVMTEPIDGAEERFPFLRDLDGYFYVRHHGGSLVVGAFEPKGKPKAPGDVPTDGFAEFGEDWDHFAPVLAAARERLPALRDTGFKHYLRAPESFTPDANFHIGEFPEVKNLFVAAGLNSQGIIYGPGVGLALAEWIVEGHPTKDLTEVDIARMGRWANNRSWLHDKTQETLGRLYAMHWPALQYEHGTWGAPLAAAAAAASGRCRRRRSRRLGSRRLVRARRSGRAVVDLRLRSPVVVRARRARRCAPRANVWPSTTSRRTRSSWCRDPRRWRACNTCAPRTSTSRSGGSSTRCCATSAAGSRWTRPSRGSTRIGTSCSRPRCTNGGPRCCCATGCRRARP